jgi:hypothetical protein
MPIDQRACVQAVEARLAPYSHCFASSSTVVVRGKKQAVPMHKLNVGDEILDSTMQYVKVIGWLHRDEDVPAEFIEITHHSGSIYVTSEHLIFCGKAAAYVPAKSAESIETVYIDGSLVRSRIISKRLVKLVGIFAPLTSSGTLLVNGVHSSCYASPGAISFPVSQIVGQVALAPYRYITPSLLPNMEDYCRTLYSIFAA